MTQPLVILDADGVFLDERPYWEAALGSALALNKVTMPSGCDWQGFTKVAFEELGLQRITKMRRCNSNFDMAAVLSLALADADTRSTIEASLAARNWRITVRTFLQFGAATWQKSSTAMPTQAQDPLSGFGIDRYGSYFAKVQQAFQDALIADRRRTGADLPAPLRGDSEHILNSLGELRKRGFELAVCTGRVADELIPPMEQHGLLEYFGASRLITADRITAAEERLGIRSLGKPHWFPLVWAGYDEAVALATLESGTALSGLSAPMVYVGDGLADFEAATSACRLGVPVVYVHVRAGVTTAAEENRIAEAPFVMGLIDQLTELPTILRDWPEGRRT